MNEKLTSVYTVWTCDEWYTRSTMRLYAICATEYGARTALLHCLKDKEMDYKDSYSEDELMPEDILNEEKTPWDDICCQRVLEYGCVGMESIYESTDDFMH